MGAKIKKVFTYALMVFILIAGCAKPIVIEPPKRPAIPANLAIAPVQIVATATLELPSSGQKNVAVKLSRPIGKGLVANMKGKGIFQDSILIPESALPSSPSIPELAQAGRDAGADVVLLGKVIEFEARPDYGFRPSLVEHMMVEFVLYEAGTGARLWHGREGIDLKRNEPISGWTEERIEARYVSMATEEMLPAVLALLIPKLYEDMAAYKPPASEKVLAAAAEFVVDVDRVPRVSIETKKNAFAVVIGIETYRDLPQAEFTVRDAKILKEYLIRVMGFPQENIITLLNDRATKGDIEGYIGAWLKNNVERDSTVFVYYAGHGAPNPVTGEAFIIPFDGNPAFPEATGIPLKKFYQTLSELQAKEILVVMDSCFSGAGGRSVMAKGGRPMAISVENPILATKNITVMTAATATEISSGYPEKRHGLFTYFFLKGLQGEADFNRDGIVSLGEIYNYVTPQVKKIAREKNLEQTPLLLPGLDLLGNKASLAIGQVGR